MHGIDDELDAQAPERALLPTLHDSPDIDDDAREHLGFSQNMKRSEPSCSSPSGAFASMRSCKVRTEGRNIALPRADRPVTRTSSSTRSACASPRQERGRLRRTPASTSRAERLQASGRLTRPWLSASTRSTSTPLPARARSASMGAATVVTIQVGTLAGAATTCVEGGSRRWESITIANRRAILKTGQAHIQLGRRPDRSDAHHDGIRMGPHQVDPAFAISPVIIRRSPFRVPRILPWFARASR